MDRSVSGPVLVAGTNNGESVFVGRGTSRGRVLVGMTTQKLSGILVEQNGVPALIKNCEILCMPADQAIWVPVASPLNIAALVSAAPVIAARHGTSEGGMVYVARVRKDGNTFITGVFGRQAGGVAYICYGKKEVASEFELLCMAS
ncbi:hypothetical protein GGI12_001510 [Dipsacomyces acuminosporus]|nr:hypothetical protein GGI12_001510 [Dipsacomyces acuminosporus]